MNGATSGSYSVRISMCVKHRFWHTSITLSLSLPGEAVMPMDLPEVLYLATVT